jgi:hypothetical protein
MNLFVLFLLFENPMRTHQPHPRGTMPFNTDRSPTRSGSDSSSFMNMSGEESNSPNAAIEASTSESRTTATSPITAQWITDQLRVMFDNVASEPLPEQFVILFRHLNEVEGISKAG